MTNNLSKELFADVAPETEQLNATLLEAHRKQPPFHEMEPADVRRYLEQQPLFPQTVASEIASERTIPGPAGDITLRQFIPKRSKAVYYHIHGGGWVLGGADHQDALLEDIAKHCNLTVVSVAYRLAPEDPYPAGPDDCEAAAVWLVENANAEYGSGRLLIGGESAGAHLSAVTLLRMRDKHGYTGFKAANLAFGWYDLGLTPSVRNFGEEMLVLSTPFMQWFAGHFAQQCDLDDPDISPLYADLRDMPPALFTVGTRDPLLDDSVFMYGRWLSAGNDAELAVYPGGVHGFNAFPIPIGLAATKKSREFLKSVL